LGGSELLFGVPVDVVVFGGRCHPQDVVVEKAKDSYLSVNRGPSVARPC